MYMMQTKKEIIIPKKKKTKKYNFAYLHNIYSVFTLFTGPKKLVPLGPQCIYTIYWAEKTCSSRSMAGA